VFAEAKAHAGLVVWSICAETLKRHGRFQELSPQPVGGLGGFGLQSPLQDRLAVSWLWDQLWRWPRRSQFSHRLVRHFNALDLNQRVSGPSERHDLDTGRIPKQAV
jgi:hypothetical protein